MLRRAAERYLQDIGELQHYHQDKQVGAPWRMIARELERCADRIEGRLLDE